MWWWLRRRGQPPNFPKAYGHGTDGTLDLAEVTALYAD